MRLKILMIAALTTLMAAAPVGAAVEVERMEMNDGTRLLMVSGTFELFDDPAGLIAAAVAFQPAAVTFHSGGGNVTAAIRFGRAIRALGLKTLQIRSADCASACTLAFIGGAQRMAEPGSIGVHQASFSDDLGLDSRSAVAAVQAVTAQIITYMVEMGVDPQLLELSLATESGDMRYLTASEMRRFRVTTEDGMTNQAPRVAAIQPSSQPDPVVNDHAPSDTAHTEAADFLRRYFLAWSSPDAEAIAFMRSAYAGQVDYYGKAIPLRDVVAEKQAFAKRWPVRAYSVRPASVKVTCEESCSIHAVVEWFARSYERQKTSTGAATLDLAWDPASGRITAEASEVIQTDKGAASPDRLIAQWQDRNGECRGGSGDEPATLEACERREELGAKLDRLDWCYGRDGEYGYQNEWHRCGPRSYGR